MVAITAARRGGHLRARRAPCAAPARGHGDGRVDPTIFARLAYDMTAEPNHHAHAQSDDHRRYTIAAADVVSEQFDQEVLVINLTTGVYYSLTGTAPLFWSALDRPLTGAELDQLVSAETGAESSTVTTARTAFVADLVAEGLVVEVEPVTVVAVVARQRYTWHGIGFPPPLLERFDDLRDLITLDPVHDIAAALSDTATS